jgi:hypothetical protein
MYFAEGAVLVATAAVVRDPGRTVPSHLSTNLTRFGPTGRTTFTVVDRARSRTIRDDLRRPRTRTGLTHRLG